jgi:NTE family protein
MPALKPLRLFEQTSFLESLLTTMLVGHDQTQLSRPWVRARTIEVESAEVGLLDFDISRKRLEEFYDKGYAAAQQFLSSWDWPEYLDQFRHSRWRLASPD